MTIGIANQFVVQPMTQPATHGMWRAAPRKVLEYADTTIDRFSPDPVRPQLERGGVWSIMARSADMAIDPVDAMIDKIAAELELDAAPGLASAAWPPITRGSSRWLGTVLILAGAILSLASASSVNNSKKRRKSSSITLSYPRCTAHKHNKLISGVRELLNRCRSAGGKGKVKYFRKMIPDSGKMCKAGTFLHGARVTCSGAGLIAHDTSLAISGNSRSAREILRAHNKWRRALNIPPLAWSDTLAKSSSTWARHLSGQGTHIYHDPTNHRYGENLAMSSGTESLAAMVDDWASEKKCFRYGVHPSGTKIPGCFVKMGTINGTVIMENAVGHYTQIIWRNSRRVGCAYVKEGRNRYLVCRYYPPGNVVGERPY